MVALLTASVSQAAAQSLERATISKGGAVLPDGSILIVGQPFAGTMTSANFTIEVGAVAFLSADITEPSVQPPLRALAPHDILKNRYISIVPRGAMAVNPSNLHIRVMVDSSLVNGLTGSGPWWATAPDSACVSVVTTTKPASEPDWSACPTVHLTGCPIVPTTTYAIAAESGGELSADALLDTQAKPGVKWHGDCVGFFTGTEWTAPNLNVNADDFVAAIKTFQDPNAGNATHVSVTDMVPNLNGDQINLIVNINDVFSIIKGFQGFEYPGPMLTLCP